MEWVAFTFLVELDVQTLQSKLTLLQQSLLVDLNTFGVHVGCLAVVF